MARTWRVVNVNDLRPGPELNRHWKMGDIDFRQMLYSKPYADTEPVMLVDTSSFVVRWLHYSGGKKTLQIFYVED